MGLWSRERGRRGEIGSEGRNAGRGWVSNVWMRGENMGKKGDRGKKRRGEKGEERGEREGRTTLGFVRRFGWTAGSFSKPSSAARITEIKPSAKEEEQETQDEKPKAKNENEKPTFAALQSLHQIVLLHDLSPTHIDQNHAIFHLSKRFPPNHTFCLFCQWACEDDDIRLGVKIVPIGKVCPFWIGCGVEGWAAGMVEDGSGADGG